MKYLKFFIVAMIVIALFFAAQGHSLSYLLNWSSAELVGYNVWTLILAGLVIRILKFAWNKTVEQKNELKK